MRIVGFSCALVLMAVAATPAVAQRRGAVQPGWLPSLENARIEAAETGKPLMIVLRCVP